MIRCKIDKKNNRFKYSDNTDLKIIRWENKRNGKNKAKKWEIKICKNI
jgi:hypothetical protein